MAFDSLSDKMQNVFKKLRSKGLLDEADVKEAMKEVKRALLEADVNFKVVKNFVNTVTEKAIGEDVMKGLNPGQMVIKIVKDELVSLMGEEVVEMKLLPSNEQTIIMMCGLQGAGKTTTVAKLAGQYKNKGKKPLLVACDIYRPAAIEQLKTNGEKVGVPVFEMGTDHKPVEIVEEALKYARANGINLVFIDTAGRLHIDTDMMDELKDVKAKVEVNYTLLTVDAMTGQDAVNVAKTFNDEIGVDGVVLTKLDGDTRGGAALSIKAVTGKPIMYAGMGEKLTDLEPFYPDRMASRILGMGDVETLIEKAQSAIDEEQAKAMEKTLREGSFNFNDFLAQMEQMEKMGSMTDIMNMIPGMSQKMGNIEIDDNALSKPRAIIQSMTPAERENPDLINISRKQRIAKGCGLDIAEVNRFMKQFGETQKMMKKMTNMMSGKGSKKRRRGGMRFPFGF
ncbi:MAG: signal recognition particle protein [Eubacterium sp.]|nr:signal recognition particle protein [Eubacterium sp.]